MIARSYCDETLPNSRRQTVGAAEAEENRDSDVEGDVGSDHELIYSEDSDEED